MPEPLTLAAIGLWVADKATGGIVSDYTKKVVKKHILRLKDETDALRLELKESREGFQSVVDKVSKLIEANDQLLRDNIRLQVENEKLRSRIAGADGRARS